MPALIVQDHTTKCFGCYPSRTKLAHDTKMGLMHFAGGAAKMNRVCTDGSGELMAMSCHLSWQHIVRTPQGPQPNCVAVQTD